MAEREDRYSDPFKFVTGDRTQPIAKAFAITPNDATDLTPNARSIYVGTSGDLTVIHASDDASVTYTNVPVGWHPVRVRRVLSSGTTASGLIGGI